MPLRARWWAAVSGLLWAWFASAAVARHFAGQPDAQSRWLSAAPVVAAAVMLAGLAAESSASRAAGRLVELLALVMISWRSLWMMFSWDGLFYFPVWCLLALAMWPRRPRRPEVA